MLQQRLGVLRAGNASLLRTRLAHAHPWHITRIARGVFLALTGLTVVLLVAALVVPLLLPDAALLIRELEEALPFPLPLLILFLSLLMGVSWITAGQAAIAVARDCPLLPWEQEEQRKLESELSILPQATAGSGFVSDTYESQPPPLMMPQTRLGSGQVQREYNYPSPVPTAGGTLRYETRPSFPPQSGTGSTGGSTSSGGGSIINKLTNPGAARRPGSIGATPAPPSGLRSGSYSGASSATPNSFGGEGGGFGGEGGGFGGDGGGFGAYPGTPPGAPQRTPSPAPSLSYRGPGGQTRSTPQSVPPRKLDKSTPTSDTGIVYDRRPHDSYTIGPDTLGDSLNDPPSGAASWKQPRFSHVDEPWLQDALSKAQSLSKRYPVQAFLEYSVEPDLPFTLVLERATPAMAVRAMVDFVGYLASISTPRRARIELRSVVHLDRSFYRSVMSAMEPYFPDTVEVRQQGYRVEITFLEPDRNWARYPILPIEE